MALYLLRGVDGITMKIGISHNPRERIMAFQDMVDVESSIYVDIDRSLSRSVEALLHFYFSDKRMNVQRRRDNGFTEWFDVSCFNECVSIVDSIMKTLDVIYTWEKIPSINNEIGKVIRNPRGKKKQRKVKITGKVVYDNMSKLFSLKPMKYKKIEHGYLFTFDKSVVEGINVSAVSMSDIVSEIYETEDNLNVLIFDENSCRELGINVNYKIMKIVKGRHKCL